MMIQDIAPYKLNNQYNPDARIKANDFVFIISGGVILASYDDLLLFPMYKQLRGIEDSELQYLFSINEESYYLFRGQMSDISIEGFQEYNINELRESEPKPKHRMFAAYTAKHLADWYRDNAYCGRCGHSMIHSKTERACTCPECGYTSYPRIMPAVIVGVRNDDKLLLTRYRSGYKYNALIAGFTEIGETLEETVAREVMEETGVAVKNISYYKSQPWGSANDILMGFFCDLDGDEAINMDSNELKYASWISREDIELQPDESSLTNEMMKVFKEGKDF